MGLEGGDGDERGDVAVLDHAPDVDVALERGGESESEPVVEFRWRDRLEVFARSKRSEWFRCRMLTELLPAHSKVPSLATVTLATETSSSGMS